jgi:LmbE family N-acetylglucosaminyl deacetylase
MTALDLGPTRSIRGTDTMTIRTAAELGTVLSIWAHPDDEAYLASGIMALAVDAGNRVVCVTATKGEAGSPDPDRWSPADMAAIRERELEACLSVLGVDEHRWLGYVDGTCPDVDFDMAADTLAAIIDDVQPDTVLTFGPDGFSDHPDHRAVSAWVTEACRRSAGGRRRDGGQLHYVTQTPGWSDEYAGPWRELGAFPPEHPPRTPPDELSIEIDLPPDVLARKMQALAEQPSQTAGPLGALGSDLYARSFAVERYRSP